MLRSMVKDILSNWEDCRDDDPSVEELCLEIEGALDSTEYEEPTGEEAYELRQRFSRFVETANENLVVDGPFDEELCKISEVQVALQDILDDVDDTESAAYEAALEEKDE